MSDKIRGLKDEGTRLQTATAGATSGLISRFIIAPLDVVKIRLQLQTHPLRSAAGSSSSSSSHGPVYKGTLQTMRHIVAHEGLTGLWKGNTPAELMYVCYSAVQFTTYRSATVLQHRLLGPQRRLPRAGEAFVSGAAAGATATAATYPLDLLRTRFAAQGNERVYPSLRRAVRDIARDEGARGFFRGLGPGVGQVVPYMGAFFAALETLRLPLGRLELPYGGGDAAAGVLASLLAKTGVFPLDLVRKRIQVQGPTRGRYVHKNIPEYSGTFSTIRAIVVNEGFRGLYRGLTVSLFKAAPASATSVWIYERVLRALMKHEKGVDEVVGERTL